MLEYICRTQVGEVITAFRYLNKTSLHMTDVGINQGRYLVGKYFQFSERTGKNFPIFAGKRKNGKIPKFLGKNF